MRNLLFSVLVATGAAWTSHAHASDYAWWLKEIRVGAFQQDAEIVEAFTDADVGDSAEDGVAINAELVFGATVTDFSNFFFNPDPFIGVHVNTDGNTNFIYGGFAWNHTFENGFFVEGTFGLAAHDGKLETPRDGTGAFILDGRAALGTRVFFRESIDIGYEFENRHRITAHISHVSNGGFFGTANEGMDFVGLRYTAILDE